MQESIVRIGLPMFITALGGTFAGGWLSMLCFVWSGAANRTIGESVERKEAFGFTVRQASAWAFKIGIALGVIVVYVFVRRDPNSAIETAHYVWVAIGSMGVGFITASGFFGIFGSSGTTMTSVTRAEQRPPHLTFHEQYEQTCLCAPGGKCAIKLIDATLEGPGVSLVYQWSAVLSDEEADRLDTRARAYIACAIYDAASTARLISQPGPLHGQRPSWRFPGEHTYVSLIHAGFDVTDKTCFMHIGPGMITGGEPSRAAGYGKQLVAGFRAQFGDIVV